MGSVPVIFLRKYTGYVITWRGHTSLPNDICYNVTTTDLNRIWSTLLNIDFEDMYWVTVKQTNVLLDVFANNLAKPDSILY